MLVSVTGAGDFLGLQIIRELLKAGHRVRAIGGSIPITLPDGVEFCCLNLAETESLDELFVGVDGVIHAAGVVHPSRRLVSAVSPETNAIVTQRVFESAARCRVRRMVLASSVSVYGGRDRGRLQENSPCLPSGDYAENKARAEQIAMHISQDSGLPTIVLRFPAIYGAGDSGNIYRLMNAIDRQHFLWIGSGLNLKSLIHVEDAARACVYAVQRVRSCPFPLYNVVGHTAAVREIATILSDELGTPLSGWRLPVVPLLCALKAGVYVGSQWSKDMLVIAMKWLSEDYVDGSRFEQDFGFKPSISLVNGLRQEVAWYRDAALRPTNSMRHAA